MAQPCIALATDVPSDVVSQPVLKRKQVGFQDFLDTLSGLLERPFHPGQNPEPVKQLLESIDYKAEDWKKFAHLSGEHYTRNLVASKDFVYDVILLCWSPNQSSAIHDHSSSGCWMRVLKGAVTEKRYHRRHNKPLECFTEGSFTSPSAFYIDNSIGLHSVHNFSEDTPCFSLHVYSPPITQCEVWRPCGNYQMFKTSLHSIYGVQLPQHFFKPSPFVPLGGKYWPLAAPNTELAEDEDSEKSEPLAKRLREGTDSDLECSIDSAQL